MENERTSRVKHMLSSRDGDKRDNAPLMRATTKHRKSNWMSGAVKPSHKGLFSAKAKAAGKSTSEYAAEKSDAPGALGKEARLAQTFAKFRK